MCGIVGLYLKNPALNCHLGALFEPMLLEMTQRGPDSTGFAIYRDPQPLGGVKIVLQNAAADFEWAEVAADLTRHFMADVGFRPIHTHCLLTLNADEAGVRRYLLRANAPYAVVSIGRHIEIYKEVGLPAAVASMFKLSAVQGSHAIGHTRMATESAVTTAGSHPFSTGSDLCLVHNGSLSNHNRLRRKLAKDGAVFRTENDSEVAAQYLDVQMRRGLSLEAALYAALKDLDGFFTFTIGTSDGFAVLRDPIACKPAVMAETPEWVAMASEYRALAKLPGVERARVWEPEPATVYVWEKGGQARAARAWLAQAS
ncbi:MAG: glutamine amidotransferase family protein [Gammaproteobacteria bacterium]|nr:glutamine amidotransferase family protein [Gammaproteobacteria bacterium]